MKHTSGQVCDGICRDNKLMRALTCHVLERFYLVLTPPHIPLLSVSCPSGAEVQLCYMCAMIIFCPGLCGQHPWMNLLKL